MRTGPTSGVGAQDAGKDSEAIAHQVFSVLVVAVIILGRELSPDRADSHHEAVGQVAILAHVLQLRRDSCLAADVLDAIEVLVVVRAVGGAHARHGLLLGRRQRGYEGCIHYASVGTMVACIWYTIRGHRRGKGEDD